MANAFFGRALVCVLLLAGSGSAQQAVKWWTDPSARARLQLTPHQSGDLDAIYQSMMPERIKNAADVKKLTDQIEALLQSPTATEADVKALADRLGAAQARRNVTRTLILFRMRNVLSPTQREALKALHDEERRARSKTGSQHF